MSVNKPVGLSTSSIHMSSTPSVFTSSMAEGLIVYDYHSNISFSQSVSQSVNQSVSQSVMSVSHSVSQSVSESVVRLGSGYLNIAL
eukprot:jgi/Chrzof1/4501/Cz14g15200.t1